MTEHDHAHHEESHAGLAADADVAAAQQVIEADAEARRGRLSRRSFLTGAAAAVPAAMLLGSGVAAARTGTRTAAKAPLRGYGAGAACALPPDVVSRIKHGWDPERSCE